MERTVLDNRYAVSSLLGGGGMGKVFLARDEVLARDVALKVLREQYASDEVFVRSFEREAKAAASLNYPHIVQVYDRGTTPEGTYYIAMEYVPGGTLKDRILREGPVAAAEAVRLASQVADALGVAHARGIVHRDVKPQNVLLTADGDAKVADFGIARAASETSASESSLSNSNFVLGTAKYMSPEQATGDPVGPASDLYSLGVVLYEMLTGEVPFDADSEVGVAMRHITDPPPSPREKNPAVPEALDAITIKMLRKKPEDRYPGAAELVADLQRVGGGLSPIFAVPAASRPASETETTQALAQPLVPAPVSEGPGAASRGSFRPLDRRRRVRHLAVAGTLVTLLAVLGLLALGQSPGAGGQVVGTLGEAAERAEQALGVGKGEVPRVVGLPKEEARGRLGEDGFGVAVELRKSPRSEKGKVLEQSVPRGEEAQRGSRIALAVGGGPRIVQAPRLVGLTSAKAENRLRGAGLELGGRKRVPNEAVPAGTVIVQDPPKGEGIKRGTEVELTVSSGPPGRGGSDQGGFHPAGGGDDRSGGSHTGGGAGQHGGTPTGGGPSPSGGQYR